MNSSIDTVRTSFVGMGGTMVAWLEVIPPFLSALTAIATLIYMILKIKNEVRR
tara:strand:- start:14857 stop:15015 length:159 start_codon:yes stop_codon:yes gene_type:complete